MIQVRNLRIAALAALAAVAACDSDSTEPEFEQLTVQEQMELSVLEDQDSYDAAVVLTTVNSEVAMEQGGSGGAEAQSLRNQAAAAFAEARAAHMAGDHRRAIDASRVARRLVAAAMIATGGVPAAEDLIERLEDMLLTMTDETIDDPDALAAELEVILEEARALLEAGDSVGAAARAILGEQRIQQRRGRHLRDFRVGAERARFEVALAQTAVGLATRLLQDDVVPDAAVTDASRTDEANSDTVRDRRNRWLHHARKWLAKAERAYNAEHYHLAVHFAWHAQWSALKAVVLPGGITEEEIRALHQLSVELHEQAVEALGDDPTDFQLRVLNRAADLIEIGVRRLQNGQKRGIAALWRSATMSAWLLS